MAKEFRKMSIFIAMFVVITLALIQIGSFLALAQEDKDEITQNTARDYEGAKIFFSSIDVSVPLMQIVFLLMISTLTLMFGKIKLALLTNYLFAFYWCFRVNFEKFGMFTPHSALFSYFYLGFGLIFVVLILFAFIYKTRH